MTGCQLQAQGYFICSVFNHQSVWQTVAGKTTAHFCLSSYSHLSRKSSWINKMTHLFLSKKGFEIFLLCCDLTANHWWCQAAKPCSLLRGAATVVSEMWSFMCTYRQVQKLNFKKGTNMFSGIFKLSSTYYLKQQTCNRALRPKEKGDFIILKLLLTIFACNCKVSITASQESLYQMAIKMCCLGQEQSLLFVLV